MGVDVRAEQFRIAFSHAHWNRFDCCDDTVSNTQPMVIEPSLSQQLLARRTCVIFLPRPEILHGSGLTSSTKLVSPRCPHSSACTRTLHRLTLRAPAPSPVAAAKLRRQITTARFFVSPALKLRGNGVPPSKSVRKQCRLLQSSWAMASSPDVKRSAVLEVSGKSMVQTAIARRGFVSLLFPLPLANPPCSCQYLTSNNLYLKEMTEFIDDTENHGTAIRAQRTPAAAYQPEHGQV